MQVEECTQKVYLADFGLGKMMNSLAAGRTTMQAGTPAFQPPEQLKAEVCGIESDIYALGCIIVEVFGGTAVWENLPPHTIILKVAGGSFPSVAHLQKEVKKITDLCLVPLRARANASTILKELITLLQ